MSHDTKDYDDSAYGASSESFPSTTSSIRESRCTLPQQAASSQGAVTVYSIRHRLSRHSTMQFANTSRATPHAQDPTHHLLLAPSSTGDRVSSMSPEPYQNHLSHPIALGAQALPHHLAAQSVHFHASSEPRKSPSYQQLISHGLISQIP